MINIQDYKDYYDNNASFFKILMDNQSMVFDRLSDIFKVLGFIEFKYDSNKKIDQELEIFFEVGFTYLYDQIEEIKIYYNNFFNSDYKQFKKYESLINFILYINDIEETLEEKEKLNEDLRKSILEISEDIENILEKKLPFDSSLFDEYNNKLMLYYPKGKYPLVTEIFSQVSEELFL